MFRGATVVNMDAKGRLAVPTRFREELARACGGHLVITIDRDEPCLLLYPLPMWEEIESTLQKLPNLNPTARRLQRLLIGHANEVDMDASGRLLLPPMLREYATLKKKVVLVGQGNKIELWSEEKWDAWREASLQESDVADLATAGIDLQELSL